MHIPGLSWIAKLATAILNSVTRRKDRRAQASAEFRTAVHRELLGLYPRPTNWPSGTGIEQRLRAAFPALQSAVSLFRSQLPSGDQAKFDEAWLVYRTATKREIDTQSYTHYMDFTSTTVSSFGGETSLKQNGKANFKRNVDRLLSFAEGL